MGMELAFTDAADFSRLAEKPLKIDSVQHKVWLQLDEQGTQAAAVTSTLMAPTAAADMEEPKTIALTRPFLFVIFDHETQSIVFLGIVNQVSMTEPNPVHEKNVHGLTFYFHGGITSNTSYTNRKWRNDHGKQRLPGGKIHDDREGRAEGQIVIPAEVREMFGIAPATSFCCWQTRSRASLCRPRHRRRSLRPLRRQCRRERMTKHERH